jgi:integral membrane protein
MINAFIWAARLEALTWAGLLLGMGFKYGPPAVDIGVRVFGRLHGAAFLIYVLVTLAVAASQRWPWWAWLLSLFAAVPPLVTVPLEFLLRRRGLLA